MAGSQLKRLKASLREQGITGPQQSKKQKRNAAQNERARNDKRLQRGVVLEGIREQFNPFDLKHAARGPKFEVTSNRPLTGKAAGGIKGRPGQAKTASEEQRRQTLLVDMQHRNKVGGILDRRFGENDPEMAPEDKMLERFAREKQRSHKKSSVFDLEEDDEPEEGLTHMGKVLSFEDDDLVDDFQEDDLEADYDSDGSDRERQRLKRLRAMVDAGREEEEDEQPERKKSKKEVMDEVIAKSKLHKYERQAAKEDDDELRTQLDKELSNVQMALSSGKNNSKRVDEVKNQAATIAGVDRDAFDKNFDLQVKQLALDRRAQPSNRTKTEEEKAEEESKRLKELEDKRQRRMRGEEVSDTDEDTDNDAKNDTGADNMEDEDGDDAFGLGSGIKTRPTATELGFDDEDDFIIEDDLVASGSELDLDNESGEEDVSTDGEEADGQHDEEDDDDFTKGLLNEEEARNPVFHEDSSAKRTALENGDEQGLPFTFLCPESGPDVATVAAKYGYENLPKIIQRIRTIYHPKLDSRNKEKLANFSMALVDFVATSYDGENSPPFTVLESVIRHVHSLAKMFAVDIATRFRHHLEDMGASRPLSLTSSDLVLLTAAGTVFPTSDHFHQVITPAILTIERYVGQKVPQNLEDYSTGTYLVVLSLQYQSLAKRYIPEVMNFALNTLCTMAPVSPTEQLGNFPLHTAPTSVRISGKKGPNPRRLVMSDCQTSGMTSQETAILKTSIVNTTIQALDAAADLWTGKSAFSETFTPVVRVLRHLHGKPCRSHMNAAVLDRAEKLDAKLGRMIRLAEISRRPLELHHHRPLAIKTYIPKFEETFDPDKHYDPDRERAELAKLRAEHKKERKGAMRELRKDANFMARENLRVKKAKDEAYEKKFKRIVAEIQSEEGREANEYEREQKRRKRERSKQS